MVSPQVARNRERLLTVMTSIGLLPGVSPCMNFEFVSCEENFVTVQTLKRLLPAVILQVHFEVT